MSEDKENKDQDPRKNPYTLKGFFNILKGGSDKKNENKESSNKTVVNSPNYKEKSEQ